MKKRVLLVSRGGGDDPGCIVEVVRRVDDGALLCLGVLDKVGRGEGGVIPIKKCHHSHVVVMVIVVRRGWQSHCSV